MKSELLKKHTDSVVEILKWCAEKLNISTEIEVRDEDEYVEIELTGEGVVLIGAETTEKKIGFKGKSYSPTVKWGLHYWKHTPSYHRDEPPSDDLLEVKDSQQIPTYKAAGEMLEFVLKMRLDNILQSYQEMKMDEQRMKEESL